MAAKDDPRIREAPGVTKPPFILAGVPKVALKTTCGRKPRADQHEFARRKALSAFKRNPRAPCVHGARTGSSEQPEWWETSQKGTYPTPPGVANGRFII